MGFGKVAVLAAALAASLPVCAQEIQNSVPGPLIYVSIPLGGGTARERAPSYGLALQGQRPYETLYIDTRMVSTFAEALAGLEAKWLIAGGLAVAGGVYISRKDKGRSDDYNNNQNKQQNSPPPPPPCDPSDPCKK